MTDPQQAPPGAKGRRAYDGPWWLRPTERLGLGSVMALIALGLVVWLVRADHSQRSEDRTAFLAALAVQTNAIEGLTGVVAENARQDEVARQVARAICPTLPKCPDVTCPKCPPCSASCVTAPGQGQVTVQQLTGPRKPKPIPKERTP